jgi:hypothetical protein
MGHTWQLLREHIRIVAHHSYVFQAVPSSLFNALAIDGAGSSANSNLSPAGLVSRTDLLAH